MIDMILESIAPHSVDLVCLPEMIFSGGYVFRLSDAVEINIDIEHRDVHLQQATFSTALKPSHRILKTLRMGQPHNSVGRWHTVYIVMLLQAIQSV